MFTTDRSTVRHSNWTVSWFICNDKTPCFCYESICERNAFVMLVAGISPAQSCCRFRRTISLPTLTGPVVYTEPAASRAAEQTAHSFISPGADASVDDDSPTRVDPANNNCTRCCCQRYFVPKTAKAYIAR